MDAAAARAASDTVKGAKPRGRKRAMTETVGVRRQSDRIVNKMMRTSVIARKSELVSRMVMKVAALTPSPRIGLSISMSWHDVMVENLLSVSELATDFIDNVSMPAVVSSTEVVADGITLNCKTGLFAHLPSLNPSPLSRITSATST